MMYQRGDFDIFHEPSQYAYNLITWPEVIKNTDPIASLNFAEVKERLFNAANTKNVFAKDLIGAAHQFISNDIEFLTNPNLHFVFLIRNPHHTIISYIHRINIVPANFSGVQWYKTMYELYEIVKAKSVHTPLLINAEDLYTNPEDTIRSFCKHVDIPYIEQALHWQFGPDFTGFNEWHEYKIAEVTHHWHGKALESTGFEQPTSYKVDEGGNPTFEEIKNEAERKVLQEVYLKNIKYYRLLLKS